MKKTTISLILLVGIVLIFFFNRFDFSATKTKSVITVSSVLSPDYKPADNDTMVIFNKPYTLVFHGIDLPASDLGNTNYKIDVYVENKSSLSIFRFLPIYKPVKINSKVNYRWNNPLKEDVQDVSGSFDINGKYKIFGSCSPKKAERDALNIINKSIIEKITSDISELLGPADIK